MDLTPLRAAYAELLDSAASRVFAAASDGGWNAGQVLGHIIIGDRDFAAVCAQLLWGLTPGYDNRASQTSAYLDAVVRAAGSWQNLIESVRRGGEELLDMLAALDDAQTAHPLVVSGVMGERELTLEMSVGEFAGNLATLHLPSHRQQLLALAAVPA